MPPVRKLLRRLSRCGTSTRTMGTTPNWSIWSSPKSQPKSLQNQHGLNVPSRLLATVTSNCYTNITWKRWQTPSTRTSMTCLQKHRLLRLTENLCMILAERHKPYCVTGELVLHWQIYRRHCGTTRSVCIKN